MKNENMTSKYEKQVLNILTLEYQSTNMILKVLEKETGKTISWYVVKSCLDSLFEKNQIDRLKVGENIILWKKEKSSKY